MKYIKNFFERKGTFKRGQENVALKDFFDKNESEINHICNDLKGMLPVQIYYSMAGSIDIVCHMGRERIEKYISLTEVSDMIDEAVDRMNDIGLKLKDQYFEISGDKGSSKINFHYSFII